jgi:hypothetical protein
MIVAPVSIDITVIYDQVAAAGARLSQHLKEEQAYLKRLRRKEAELMRKATQARVSRMAKSTPESRIAAARARAAAFYAQVDDINAQADLKAVEAQVDDRQCLQPVKLSDIRVDDLYSLFSVPDQLPAWLGERVNTLHAKFNWETRKGHKGYFNVAVNDNDIPIDQALTTLAHLANVDDGCGHSLDGWVESVIECGLYPKIRKGKFTYVRRCQDGEHCELCNYVNISDGLKELLCAYSKSAFYRGGHWFAITVAPRRDRCKAKAVGRTITQKDWQRENPESAVYRESYQTRAFRYRNNSEECEEMDWAVGACIRFFLGAVQCVFGKLVKNGWLDGIRAKVENSVEFLPFRSHQHWHGVGCSMSEHDPQKMADFIKAEVDAVLANTEPGLHADVLVAVISTPEDLQKWVNYINKTVNLVEPVESIYNRYPSLKRTDALFMQFMQELRLYPQRSRQVFGMARNTVFDETGKHTYMLRRRYVAGIHKFGKGSVLSESKRHREWRKRNAKRVKEARNGNPPNKRKQTPREGD